jgi:hypothetical protein
MPACAEHVAVLGVPVVQIGSAAAAGLSGKLCGRRSSIVGEVLCERLRAIKRKATRKPVRDFHLT